MKTYENVSYHREDSIARITLNRPDKLNAMDDAMLRDLEAAVLDAEHDIEAKVVVIRAAGTDFSVGADPAVTSEELPDPRAAASLQELMETERRRSRRWESIFNFPRPTIAQVQGRCLGPGFYLAMACDLVFAAEDAVFGDPAVRMGLLPSMPLIIWLVGAKKAREVVYLGRLVGALEAEQMGLINAAVPRERLEAEVNRYAQALNLCPADGLPFVKEAINAALEARGVGEAWRFTSEMGMLARARAPLVEPGQFDFFSVRDQEGPAAAVRKRDALLEDLL